MMMAAEREATTAADVRMMSFEDGGRTHKPRTVSSLQLGRQENRFPQEPPEVHSPANTLIVSPTTLILDS